MKFENEYGRFFASGEGLGLFEQVETFFGRQPVTAAGVKFHRLEKSDVL